MFITIPEILDMILMIAVIGFVFMNLFKHPVKTKYGDELNKYLSSSRFGFSWHDFLFAALVTAPAILLHELGHKITALSFGLTATFHAAYIWLLIAVVLRLINFPFIFFVPAYVSIFGPATTSQSTIVAFAGPGVNLILFLAGLIVLKSYKNLRANSFQFWTLTRNINLFLFIFNMIPIPGFDGFTVFTGLWKIIGL
jgi:Zn-dependent protease